MLRLLGIVLSIGLADSLNPSTLGPGLFLAASPHPRRAVAKFAVGVFSVYLVGGCLVALGPGELVLSLVPKPDQSTQEILEIIAGGVLIGAGVLLWRYRVHLAEKQLPTSAAGGRASWLLGMTIMAIELPTAFPYFGALAAIVGSDHGVAVQALLILIYNVCFISPLIAILLTLTFAGDHAQPRLRAARDFLQHHWALVLSVVALVAGGIVITLGVTGAVSHVDGDLGTVAKKIHQLLPH